MKYSTVYYNALECTTIYYNGDQMILMAGLELLIVEKVIFKFPRRQSEEWPCRLAHAEGPLNHESSYDCGSELPHGNYHCYLKDSGQVVLWPVCKGLGRCLMALIYDT